MHLYLACVATDALVPADALAEALLGLVLVLGLGLGLGSRSG